MTHLHLSAFDQGSEAYAEGKSRDDNPYEDYDSRYYEWLLGWYWCRGR